MRPSGYKISGFRKQIADLGVSTAVQHIADGRRVRVGGMVITRRRPGTAKGFVLLTLEDETGLVNVSGSRKCTTATGARSADRSCS